MTLFSSFHPTVFVRRLQSLSFVLLVCSLTACGSFDNIISGDKVDYRSSGSRTAGLDVPPDLTQLSRDTRYQTPAGGSVSAASFQSAAGGTGAVAAAVAPQAVASVRIERQGQQRWLVTSMAPEQLWPQLQAFWEERGFTLETDQADIGVMETNWAENRAKLPKDLIRSSLGSLVDFLYSTGERDRFRTRVERSAAGTEVYITHRGMAEVYSGDRKESTVWEARATDPQLEAEMLQRLLLKLGNQEQQAKTALAAATIAANSVTSVTTAAASSRARLVEGSPAVLQVDENFDRAWRRVGLALDRSGFTVEDRDRAKGVYFVRYVEAGRAGKDDPGFFSKLFSFGKSKANASGPTRYRVAVTADGEQRSSVAVQNAEGGVENSETGRRIAGLLLDDLR